MTDHTDTLLKTLLETEAGLQAKLQELTAALTQDSDGDPPDKIARAVTVTLKAIEDARNHREAIEAKTEAAKYTRWEDLPPPSPEDEARYYEQFKTIFDYVVEADAAGLDLSSDADSPADMARSHLARRGKAKSA